MCDVKKYETLYKDMMQLSPEDTAEIILESDDEDIKDFYELIGDFILQKRQRRVIRENLF